EVRMHGRGARDVESVLQSLGVAIAPAGAALRFRGLTLVAALKRVEKPERLAERIPVEIGADRSAQESAIDPALDEVAVETARAGGHPKPDVDSPPPPVVAAPSRIHAAAIRALEGRIVCERGVVNGTQTVFVVAPRRALGL